MPAEKKSVVDQFAKAFYALDENIPTEVVLGALEEVIVLIEASEKR